MSGEDASLPAILTPAPSSEPSPSPDPTKTPCWECSRRGWTCDGSLPVCNRCKAASIVCPGYGDSKPLVWLAPGRVTSRTRRQKPGPKSKASAKESCEIKTKVKKEGPDSATKGHRKPSNTAKEDQDAKVQSVIQTGHGKSSLPSRLSLDPHLLSAVVHQQQSPTIHPPLIGTKPTELSKEWSQIVEVAQYCRHRNAPT